METPVTMRLVEGRLKDVLAVKAFINEKYGGEPTVSLRMELKLGPESVTMTINEDLIVVRDDKQGKVIATGDWELAKLALKGMDAQEAEEAPPTG